MIRQKKKKTSKLRPESWLPLVVVFSLINSDDGLQNALGIVIKPPVGDCYVGG